MIEQLEEEIMRLRLRGWEELTNELKIYYLLFYTR